MDDPRLSIPHVKNSLPFLAMAEKITLNHDAMFGGACVIIPPGTTGEPIELLMLDAQGDEAQFWSTILTRIQMVIQKISERERNLQGFGRPR